MASILLLVEGSSVFGIVYGVLTVWSRLSLSDWVFMAPTLAQSLVFSLSSLAAFYYNGLYNLRDVRSLDGLWPRLTRSVPLALLLLALIYTLFPQMKIPPAALVLSMAIVGCLVFALRAVLYWLLQRRPFVKRVLILGTGLLARKLVREIENQPAARYAIVGLVDDSAVLETPLLHYPLRKILERLGYPYMGPLKHLRKIIGEVRPDRIIVAQPEGLDRSHVRHVLLESRPSGVVIEDGVEVYERLTGKVAIEWLTPQSLIFSKDFRRSRLDQALARAMSLSVATLGLIVLAPVFGLIALAIKLDSTGPVLFVQERIGRRGKPFNLLKFRTMHPTVEKTSEWVCDNVDRITRVGKWLRRFRLDEIPQFWNVFRGHMNLVGPRPHPVSNFALFVLVSRNAPECGQPIPFYALRSMVRPGITGWAQIRYRYANGLEEEIEKMRYDLYYIKHMSVWLDLRILSETVRVVLFGQESRPASHPDQVPANQPEPGFESAA
ncbi:MAG TPA: sugar transferase [Candidatus Binatia bacterium]|jgi:exopolysaccharide biosynthesis polyprenyl glycosylphosphotransferase